MIASAQSEHATDVLAPAIHDQPLTSEIADYINHLLVHNAKAAASLTLRIHPLAIAENLNHELEAHERRGAQTSEKFAAEELSEPVHPHQTAAARQQFANIIAEMIAPLADATLAHHLLLILTFGENLPAPHAVDRLGICASFDSKYKLMSWRFAPGREIEAPHSEFPVAAGMTLVCEPLETGYYRIPDDKRYRNSEGLIMGDSIFAWSLQALQQMALLQEAYQAAEFYEKEGIQQLDRRYKAFFFRWLMQRREAETTVTSQTSANPLTVRSKIIYGRFAGEGTVHTRNVEHRAALTLTERQASSAHNPILHSHLPGPEIQPE